MQKLRITGRDVHRRPTGALGSAARRSATSAPRHGWPWNLVIYAANVIGY